LLINYEVLKTYTLSSQGCDAAHNTFTPLARVFSGFAAAVQ
jgi:hypothetical protein